MPNILIVGNCQTQQIAALLGLVPGNIVVRHSVHELRRGQAGDLGLEDFDRIVTQTLGRRELQKMAGFAEAEARMVTVPSLQFRGYHPDFVHVGGEARLVQGSRIVANAYAAGLSAEEAAELFTPTIFTEMGYYTGFETEKAMFLSVLADYLDTPLEMFEAWHDRPENFYVPNHPSMQVTLDVLTAAAGGQGLKLPPPDAAEFLNDPLKEKARFPTLNHLRSRNRLEHRDHLYVLSGALSNRLRFARRCYRKLALEPGPPDPAGLQADRFAKALDAHGAETRVHATNPYKGQPERAFWKTAVAAPDPSEVAPASELVPVIGPGSRVATAGSCFAYHIAKTLQENALDYFVAEPPPADLPPETAAERGYGTFSARFGNIYSPRQLVQLFDRAHGRFKPRQSAWPAKGGGWIDPFRPNIGETYPSPAAVAKARKDHLAAVRRMFEELDVFVFTLGLTECWTDATDGAIFPVAPGVVSDGVPADTVRFENLDPGAVTDDMTAFLLRLKAVNPAAQVILTVSPVPLIATYSGQDVLAATTYSKSVLRAAAGRLAGAFGFVQYFPSYEIVTGPHAGGRYFAADLRSVTDAGVAHVMRVFLKTMVTDEAAAPAPAPVDFSQVVLSESYQADAAFICDEELAVRDI